LSYATLRQAQQTDYQALFNRVVLDLGTNASTFLPTGQRVRQIATVDDPQLFALYFQMGRYLMISGSRGSLPMGLQGPWLDGNDPDWMGDYHTAMNSVIILNAWTTSGTFMLFYLASLQSISHEVYEAAAIDGADAWQTFWKVTFPLLRPAHFFVATVGVIGGLQLFDQAFIVSGGKGGPANSTLTAVLYLYQTWVGGTQLGYAAAVGIALFLIIFFFTLVQRLLFGRAEIGY